jgi:hypothetical protein
MNPVAMDILYSYSTAHHGKGSQQTQLEKAPGDQWPEAIFIFFPRRLSATNLPQSQA